MWSLNDLLLGYGEVIQRSSSDCLGLPRNRIQGLMLGNVSTLHNLEDFGWLTFSQLKRSASKHMIRYTYNYIYILLQDSWGWHIGGLPPEVRSTYSTWIIYVCLPFVLNWFPWLQKWFGMDSSRFVPSARILCHASSIAGCVDHCHVGWRNIFCFSHHMSFAHHSKTQTPQIEWNPLTSFKVLVRLLGGFVDSCDWSELVLHSLMLGI